MYCNWLHQAHIGSPEWWSRLEQHGSPWITPAEDGGYWASFFWQDPQGSEQLSKIQRVWLNITGVTDHHQGKDPISLQRILQTDVWVAEIKLTPQWRGSYMFIPSMLDDDFQGNAEDMYTLRRWWQNTFVNGTEPAADKLNPARHWFGGRGHCVSPLSMPDAPPQTAWQSVDQGQESLSHSRLQTYQWHSQILGNSRDIWTLGLGQPTHTRPLAIILDGKFWTQQMPLPVALESLTQQHRLPPAVYLFIDSLDNQQRAHELPCNMQFWDAVENELLPQLSQWEACSCAAETTIIAGQSFGGLSAAFAILNKPHLATSAICQSSSFWWPNRHHDASDSFMINALQQQQFSHVPRKFFIEAGIREKLIYRANEQVVSLLKQANHQVIYRDVDGGHDALCWRGGLTDGLQAIWSGHHFLESGALSYEQI